MEIHLFRMLSQCCPPPLSSHIRYLRTLSPVPNAMHETRCSLDGSTVSARLETNGALPCDLFRQIADDESHSSKPHASRCSSTFLRVATYLTRQFSQLDRCTGHLICYVTLHTRLSYWSTTAQGNFCWPIKNRCLPLFHALRSV